MVAARKVETVYTEQEWMNHVEHHAKVILKRYAKRKARRLVCKIIRLIPFVLGATAFMSMYIIISLLEMYL